MYCTMYIINWASTGLHYIMRRISKGLLVVLLWTIPRWSSVCTDMILCRLFIYVMLCLWTSSAHCQLQWDWYYKCIVMGKWLCSILGFSIMITYWAHWYKPALSTSKVVTRWGWVLPRSPQNSPKASCPRRDKTSIKMSTCRLLSPVLLIRLSSSEVITPLCVSLGTILSISRWLTRVVLWVSRHRVPPQPAIIPCAHCLHQSHLMPSGHHLN